MLSYGVVSPCRELLRLGSEVVLVGNTLPAINDVTEDELVSVLDDVSQLCPTIQVSLAGLHRAACWCHSSRVYLLYLHVMVAYQSMLSMG